MTKLTPDELSWYINNFADEYMRTCILIENFICDDYDGYYDTFWKHFNMFLNKRKEFDTHAYLSDVYNDLYKYITPYIEEQRIESTVIFRTKPTSADECNTMICKLREIKEGEYND